MGKRKSTDKHENVIYSSLRYGKWRRDRSIAFLSQGFQVHGLGYPLLQQSVDPRRSNIAVKTN